MARLDAAPALSLHSWDPGWRDWDRGGGGSRGTLAWGQRQELAPRGEGSSPIFLGEAGSFSSREPGVPEYLPETDPLAVFGSTEGGGDT